MDLSSSVFLDNGRVSFLTFLTFVHVTQPLIHMGITYRAVVMILFVFIGMMPLHIILFQSLLQDNFESVIFWLL